MIVQTPITIEDKRFSDKIKDIFIWTEFVCDKAWNIALAYNPNIPQKDVEISVLLTDDKKITEINNTYRCKNAPTNVISFASIDSIDNFDDFNEFLDDDDDDVFLAGDIIVSFDTTLKEAIQNLKNNKKHNVDDENSNNNDDEELVNQSFKNHFTHLLVHGIMHLAGFDHIDDEEAEIMEKIEIEILKEFSIDNPYKEIDEE